MSTLNSSKLPEKTLASTSTFLPTLSAIEFVRKGATVYACDFTVAEWYQIINDAIEAYKPHFRYFEFLEPEKCLQLQSFLVAHNFMLQPSFKVVLYCGWSILPKSPKFMVLARLSSNGDDDSPKILERHLLLSRDAEVIELTREVTKVKFRDELDLSLPTLNGEAITKYHFRILSELEFLAELSKPRISPLGMRILYALREHALIAIRSKRMYADAIEKKVNSLLEMERRIEG